MRTRRVLFLLSCAGFALLPHGAEAGWPRRLCSFGESGCAPWTCTEGAAGEDIGGSWYWLRSPEQEKRVIASHYNRYCIRCHGVDGRGVWDIPDVPNFANVRWQASRSDGQLARLILEGRGAVMPAFRGTLTLEEAWAMARYLRSFVPGSEAGRPEHQEPQKPAGELPAPTPTRPAGAAKEPSQLPVPPR